MRRTSYYRRKRLWDIHLMVYADAVIIDKMRAKKENSCQKLQRLNGTHRQWVTWRTWKNYTNTGEDSPNYKNHHYTLRSVGGRNQRQTWKMRLKNWYRAWGTTRFDKTFYNRKEIYDKSKKVMKSNLHTLQDIMIGENAIGTLITTTSEEKQNDPEQHSHRESQQGETTWKSSEKGWRRDAYASYDTHTSWWINH